MNNTDADVDEKENVDVCGGTNYDDGRDAFTNDIH